MENDIVNFNARLATSTRTSSTKLTLNIHEELVFELQNSKITNEH